MTRMKEGEDNGPLTQGHPHGEGLLSKFTTAAKQTLQPEDFTFKKKKKKACKYIRCHWLSNVSTD